MPESDDLKDGCMQKRNGFAILGVFLASLVTWVLTPTALSDETAIVYSVFKGIDLGNPNEMIQRDYFINLGTNQGIKVGTVLEVARKAPSYDLTTEKLYKDLVFPFAQIKVIHAERDAAIARLEKLYPLDKTPALTPRSVVVGDLVKVTK